jgi:hypothetical protein
MPLGHPRLSVEHRRRRSALPMSWIAALIAGASPVPTLGIAAAQTAARPPVAATSPAPDRGNPADPGVAGTSTPPPGLASGGAAEPPDRREAQPPPLADENQRRLLMLLLMDSVGSLHPLGGTGGGFGGGGD